MNLSAWSRVATAAVIAGASLGASAEVVRYDFSGTLAYATGSLIDGAAFTAYLAVDYGGLVYEVRHQEQAEASSPIGARGLVTGSFSSAGTTLDFSSFDPADATHSLSFVSISRDYGEPYFGENDFVVRSLQYFSATAANRFLTLDVNDVLGLATNLFYTAPGDLSLPQSVNWFGSGGTRGGEIFDSATSNQAVLVVNAVSVSQVTAVPEPDVYALLLAGLGVAGLVAHRRRRSSLPTIEAAAF